MHLGDWRRVSASVHEEFRWESITATRVRAVHPSKAPAISAFDAESSDG